MPSETAQRLDELVQAAGGDPLAAALDIAEQLNAQGREDEALDLLDTVLAALGERARAAAERTR